jgi:hypothetical protein
MLDYKVIRMPLPFSGFSNRPIARAVLKQLGLACH